jgi:hypothetical protein
MDRPLFPSETFGAQSGHLFYKHDFEVAFFLMMRFLNIQKYVKYLKIEAAGYFAKFVNANETIWYYIPEESNLHTQKCSYQTQVRSVYNCGDLTCFSIFLRGLTVTHSVKACLALEER